MRRDAKFRLNTRLDSAALRETETRCIKLKLRMSTKAARGEPRFGSVPVFVKVAVRGAVRF